MRELARLSDRERQVLRLLAQGHTAKSAAIVLGVSANTVNERLREARRKTGAPSSRELARKLSASLGVAAKTCDEEIGVDVLPGSAAHPPGRVGGSADGGWMMFAAVSALSALAAAAGVLGLEPAAVAPRVTSTSPRSGAVVSPGPVELSVTFSRPMRSDSYSFTRLSPATYPACVSAPAVSSDGRTFTLACALTPHRRYALGFNSVRYRNFVSAEGGIAAAPAVLRFSTR